MADVPVLVLSGDLDAITPSEYGHAAAAHVPNAKWVEVVGAGQTPSVATEGQQLITEFIGEDR